MLLATAAQIKEIDRIAIEERGIQSTVLMERAARALTEEVQRLSDGLRSAVVFCGPGNNGGDGIAAARFLLESGWNIKCVLVGSRDKMSADSLEMERRLRESGGALENFCSDCPGEYSGFDVAVDALFGVGLNSNLRTDAVSAAELMKTARYTVAADLPSGIQADTGAVLGNAVRADVTVTFSLAKPGLFVGQGAVHSGRVVVADIGVPQDLLSDFACQTMITEAPVLPRRKRDAHKGDFGRLLILAGSREYTGAPVICARSAVCAGAGLVTLAVPEEVWPIAAVKCDEAMVWALPDVYEEILKKASAADAVVIGPGLGQNERAERLVCALLRDLKCPVVVDADGLNLLAKHIDVLDNRDGPTVLTPHDGEFARLSGCELPIMDRLGAAREFAVKHRCILVLKGHRTIIADQGGSCMINTTGNPGMARGGSGDALAGILGAMLCQFPMEKAVCEGVWLHGRSGDLAAQELGEYGMTILDLIACLPHAMKERTEGE